MATKYIPDELIAEIVNNGDDVQSFIREAIEEKLACGRQEITSTTCVVRNVPEMLDAIK